MTVTTIFAEAADEGISSQNATYATARTGGTLALMTNSLAVGQATGFNCYEGFVSFDTSPIPDADIISAAVLALDGAADGSTTDFTVEARTYDWGTGVTTADWVSGASLSGLTLLATWSSTLYSNAYNTFTNSGTALVDAINKSGSTRMMICSDRHRLGTQPINNENVIFTTSETAGTGSDPKLTITHAGLGGVSGPIGRGVIPA